MRSLSALALAVALLAGCASDEPEPAATDDADTVDRTDEEPTGDGVADADADAAPDTDDAQPDATDNDTTEADAADDEGASAGTGEVEIGDFFFDDDQLSIEVGDTVTWTHQGDITHNVTSRDETFASDNLSSGETFSHTFDDPGSFEYVCTLHGQMTATVEVS